MSRGPRDDEHQPSYVPPGWSHNGANRWLARSPWRMLLWQLGAPIVFVGLAVQFFVERSDVVAVLCILGACVILLRARLYLPRTIAAIRESRSDSTDV